MCRTNRHFETGECRWRIRTHGDENRQGCGDRSGVWWGGGQLSRAVRLKDTKGIT